MTDNVSITPDIVHFFNSSFVLEDQLGIGSILKGDVSWWLIHECSLSGLCERATKLQPLRVPNPPLHLAPHVWRYRSSCPHQKQPGGHFLKKTWGFGAEGGKSMEPSIKTFDILQWHDSPETLVRIDETQRKIWFRMCCSSWSLASCVGLIMQDPIFIELLKPPKTAKHKKNMLTRIK